MGEASCAFTGHRAAKLPWGYDESDPRCAELKKRIRDAAEAAYETGTRRFLCGMAEGCDLYFAEAVLALRDAYPDILLEAAVPFAGQADRWSDVQRRRYFRLLAACDARTVLQETYTRDCMMRRNRYMVDRAGLLIACYDWQTGGTRSTIRYAMDRGIPVVHIQL